MSDLHNELEAWAKSAYTRDLFCGATSLSETLRAASARIATLTADRDAMAEKVNRARDDAVESSALLAETTTAAPAQYNAKDHWRAEIGREVAAAIRSMKGGA